MDAREVVVIDKDDAALGKESPEIEEIGRWSLAPGPARS